MTGLVIPWDAWRGGEIGRLTEVKAIYRGDALRSKASSRPGCVFTTWINKTNLDVITKNHPMPFGASLPQPLSATAPSRHFYQTGKDGGEGRLGLVESWLWRDPLVDPTFDTRR